MRKAVLILLGENGVYSIPMFQTHDSEQTDETSCIVNNRVARCQEWTVTVWLRAANWKRIVNDAKPFKASGIVDFSVV